MKASNSDFIKSIINNISKKRELTMLLVFLLINTLISLTTPIVTKNFINLMDLSQITLKNFFVLAFFFIFQLVFSVLSTYLLNYISSDLTANLRTTLYKKVLSLNIKYFEKNSAGKVSSILMNDTLIVKEFLSGQLIPFISSALSIVGSIFLMVILDWKITIAMVVGIPITIISSALLSRKAYEVSNNIQEQTASLQGQLGNILSEIKLVKFSNAENLELTTGKKYIDNLKLLELKEARVFALVQPLSSAIVLMLLVGIIGYGSYRVSTGTLTAGDLVAILFYLFNITTPTSQLFGFSSHMQKAKASFDRLEQLKDEQSEKVLMNNSFSLTSNKTAPILEFDRVNFSYVDNKQILKDVCFKIEKGETLAIVGPSGSGKTTVFSLIEQFYQSYSGEIRYYNNDVSKIGLSIWRQKIAYVSQDSPILPGTLLYNLTYGLDSYSSEDLEYAIRAANLKDVLKANKDGLDTFVGERGMRLSGGQRQRVAIARAILRKPDILLLDEATAHLDSESEFLVQRALEELKKDRTTITIAHRLSTIKGADQILFLEQGRVTGIGDHQFLSRNHSLYNSFIKQQNIS